MLHKYTVVNFPGVNHLQLYAGSSYQRHFFFPTHLLDCILTFACCRARILFFLVDENHRAPGTRIVGGQLITRIMLCHAPRHIPAMPV